MANPHAVQPFYVYSEDLAAGLVGPFLTRQQAEAHVAFCRIRGDADPGTVLTWQEAGAKLANPGMMLLSPEADRVYAPAGLEP